MVIHLLSPQNNKSMKNTDDKKVDNEIAIVIDSHNNYDQHAGK